MPSGKSVSLKEFKEQNRDKFIKYAISKKDVLSRKILTRAQLKKAIEGGLLREVSFQSRAYFIRKELMNYMNKIDSFMVSENYPR